LFVQALQGLHDGLLWLRALKKREEKTASSRSKFDQTELIEEEKKAPQFFPSSPATSYLSLS
jgi:hypothetical protein